jgi:hypothetical protein
MTCNELKADYETYALGALDGAELAELREHLSRNCENCAPGVGRALALVARVSAGVTQVDPPKRLRARVIGLVNPDEGRSRLGWLAALAITAAGLVAVGYMGFEAQRAAGELEAARQTSARRQNEIARLNETLALLEDPVAREVTFGKGANGRIVISPSHGVAFSGQNLAALAPGKTYEMWIIPKRGKPVPAGTFAPAADGSALHVRTGPVDPDATAAVAISIENAGGVASPTTDQIIIVAPVGQ